MGSRREETAKLAFKGGWVVDPRSAVAGLDSRTEDRGLRRLKSPLLSQLR